MMMTMTMTMKMKTEMKIKLKNFVVEIKLLQNAKTMSIKPRNWARTDWAGLGLDRVGLGWAGCQGVWAGSGRPTGKPG